MATITVIDREGEEHTIEATPGWSVMEIIRENDLPIEAACGGCCACATCHVYIGPEWFAKLPAPSEEELSMLDEAFEVEANSRLSCQVLLTAAQDGMAVTVAPDWD